MEWGWWRGRDCVSNTPAHPRITFHKPCLSPVLQVYMRFVARGDALAEASCSDRDETGSTILYRLMIHATQTCASTRESLISLPKDTLFRYISSTRGKRLKGCRPISSLSIREPSCARLVRCPSTWRSYYGCTRTDTVSADR